MYRSTHCKPSSRWRWIVSMTLRTLYPQRKKDLTHWYMHMVNEQYIDSIMHGATIKDVTVSQFWQLLLWICWSSGMLRRVDWKLINESCTVLSAVTSCPWRPRAAIHPWRLASEATVLWEPQKVFCVAFFSNTSWLHWDMYEGHLESKERFAIKKYLLIIGKKKNMQVLSHTFTYFST